jgi:hypothetical protein
MSRLSWKERIEYAAARLKSRVEHEAKSRVIYFSGDIISCSLLLRILLFMTYRRPGSPRRAAAVMGAGGADGTTAIATNQPDATGSTR